MALNSSDTNLSTLVVNKCTKEQYDAMTNKSLNELYVVPEDIDATPTQNSTNPVSSGGMYTALSGKQNTLTFDSTPTANSTNPVTSGGIYTAIAANTNTLNKIDSVFDNDSPDYVKTKTVTFSAHENRKLNVNLDCDASSYYKYVGESTYHPNGWDIMVSASAPYPYFAIVQNKFNSSGSYIDITLFQINSNNVLQLADPDSNVNVEVNYIDCFAIKHIVHGPEYYTFTRYDDD